MRRILITGGAAGALFIISTALLSAQDHTTFDGYRLRGWPTQTIRAGRVVFDKGKVVGVPDGRYLKRPDALHSA